MLQTWTLDSNATDLSLLEAFGHSMFKGLQKRPTPTTGEDVQQEGLGILILMRLMEERSLRPLFQPISQNPRIHPT